jgi:hypothetical protein
MYPTNASGLWAILGSASSAFLRKSIVSSPVNYKD